jgi:hypothetical protein
MGVMTLRASPKHVRIWSGEAWVKMECAEEVERPAEDAELESLRIMKGGALEGDEVPADVVADRGVQEPPVRLDPEVSAGLQIRDEEAARTERAAADVEKRVVLAETEKGEEVELGGPGNVVTARRPDIRAVRSHPGREIRPEPVRQHLQESLPNVYEASWPGG